MVIKKVVSGWDLVVGIIWGIFLLVLFIWLMSMVVVFFGFVFEIWLIWVLNIIVLVVGEEGMLCWGICLLMIKMRGGDREEKGGCWFWVWWMSMILVGMCFVFCDGFWWLGELWFIMGMVLVFIFCYWYLLVFFWVSLGWDMLGGRMRFVLRGIGRMLRLLIGWC